MKCREQDHSSGARSRSKNFLACLIHFRRLTDVSVRASSLNRPSIYLQQLAQLLLDLLHR
jgi:hypothetical protein